MNLCRMLMIESITRFLRAMIYHCTREESVLRSYRIKGITCCLVHRGCDTTVLRRPSVTHANKRCHAPITHKTNPWFRHGPKPVE